MSKNKVAAWFDLQNEKTCLKICSMYYKKLADDGTAYYIFNPKFYPFLLLRLLMLSINFFKVNVKQQHPNQTGLSGLRHFIKPNYEPAYYHQLLKDKELEFSTVINPVVSIIIPAHLHIDDTKACLKSILANISNRYTYEVIVIKACLTDNAALTSINGLLLAENEEKAIDLARGEYICRLNQEAIILPQWLESLVETIKENNNIGCVGSKSLYPHGLLLEAGGIINSDGSFINYGANQHPKDHQYDYKRKVDCCATTSFLFRKSDYLQIGCLNKLFSPIYGIIDFCFLIRHTLNKQVLYQPLSALVQLSAQLPDLKNLSTFNDQKVFEEKWAEVLHNNYPTLPLDSAAKRHLPKKTITVIDTYLPFFDKESGSNRLFQLLKIFQQLGYHVCFVPSNGKHVNPYYDLLTAQLGITVPHNFLGKSHFKQSVANLVKETDMLWICRPQLNFKYQYLARKNPKVKWIFDTVDLHYVRLFRQAESEKRHKLKRKALRFKKLELKLAAAADATITVTPVEKELLIKEQIKSVYVIPNVHDFKQSADSPAFQEREGLLFIGGYKHGPNVDAVVWFVKYIMPIVWEELGKIPVYLLGSYPNKEVLSLANDNVIVPGYLEDVSPYFLKSRVFVAPLRYGAGMKGKIGQSLEYGLPIVSTSIGVEGMNLTHEHSALIADEAEAFASKVIQLYKDQVIWQQIKDNSLKSLTDYTPKMVNQKLKDLFDDLNIKN